METVTVLLATYNGERYLEEQLDSLLAQENILLKILVRDDGSKDNTRNILNEYAHRHSNIKVLLGDNCGAEESFNRLCKYALQAYHSDYYAFCDQDDIWDKDKLSIAVNSLKGYSHSVPALYFSNLLMVDENLTPLGMMYKNGEVKLSKQMALTQIFTYGCTCVFNQKALEIYCLCDNNLVHHDNWIYVLCKLLGHVVYDRESHLRYRQHPRNLSEHKTSGLSKVNKRIMQLGTGKMGHKFEIISKQLIENYEQYLVDDDIRYLINLLSTYRFNLGSKIRLFFSRAYRTGNLAKDFCIRLRIMANHL